MRTVLAMAAAVVAQPVAAQVAPVPAAADAWRQLTTADADAALALITDNHPGAAAELDDRDFQAKLAAARAHVAERLPRVTGYAGYSAVMNGLANDFRDGHIWSRAILAQTRRSWAGLVVIRQAGAWIVGAQDEQSRDPDLDGARVTACDGMPVDRLAARRIGDFYGNPAIEADLASRAPLLLIDDANPFAPRAVTCSFATVKGTTKTVTLNWRPISQSGLEAAIRPAMRAARAGMGVAPFAGGYWIALGTLDDSAQAVVDAVEAQQAALRAAPMVVIDLRGNGGGNSGYADAILTALVGKTRFDALPGMGQCSGAFWRASPGNRAALQEFAAQQKAAGNTQGVAYFDSLDRDIATALQTKAEFAPALPPCARRTAVAASKPVKLPPAAMLGRLVVLTDRACFSSCLIAVDRLRALGAEHVGEATNMSTRYMEVREITLPSGLRTFSTLQKVAVGLGDFGPYTPDRAYPGAMDDGDALKAWVAALPAR